MSQLAAIQPWASPPTWLCYECRQQWLASVNPLPGAPPITRPETAEEHLGNALQMLRAWKQARRQPTLEEYGAVLVRVQKAMQELAENNA